ncbi:MiaB/RimO family radical SAM methylthiotransferase [Patescibacteria group bacterium]
MKYFVKTYGCQMNKSDSEKIAGAFKVKGYTEAKLINDADVIIINTCSVRQSAEDRVLGLVNNLSRVKSGDGSRKIILTGCMLRYTKLRLKKMLPFVDEFVKLHELVGKSKSKRKDKLHAWVSIMEGCDNYCTYCVVPYARGREQSRSIEEIYCEVKQLADRGHKEITLLGQNVNSYHKNKKFKIKDKVLLSNVNDLKKEYKNNFAILLCLLHGIKGIQKIKFITSNPHDLTDDIIKVLKLPKIDRYLHLAVQSGDDEILKKMNRKYKASEYISLINKIKKEIPDIEIGTDIIVGFPGETEEQFKNTYNLCKKVNFKVAYVAKYSPRVGTAAYKFKDDVSFKTKKKRWEILNKLINK